MVGQLGTFCLADHHCSCWAGASTSLSFPLLFTFVRLRHHFCRFHFHIAILVQNHFFTAFKYHSHHVALVCTRPLLSLPVPVVPDEHHFQIWVFHKHHRHSLPIVYFFIATNRSSIFAYWSFPKPPRSTIFSIHTQRIAGKQTIYHLPVRHVFYIIFLSSCGSCGISSDEYVFQRFLSSSLQFFFCQFLQSHFH